MRSSRAIAGGWLAILLAAGCGGVDPAEPHEVVDDPAQLFMQLKLDHRAVNLSLVAPSNTLQLTATPLSGTGAPLSGLPAPTFRSTDTTRVWVTPEGLVQARAVATGIRVIAELKADGNVRHADTATVNVTANPAPPVLETFSIDPVPPDSAVWSMVPLNGVLGNVLLRQAGINVSPRLVLRALDAGGKPVAGLAVEYESLDPEIIQVQRTTGQVGNPSRPGQGAVAVRTFAYGVTKADTAVFTVRLPILHGVQIEGEPGAPPSFSPTEVTIRRNGYVFWTNLTTQAVEVTFDDPTNVAEIPAVCAFHGGALCGAGNIPSFDGTGGSLKATRGRQFPVPGVYTYHITGIGATGRVVVLEE